MHEVNSESRRLGLGWALIAAILGGVSLDLATPGVGLWWAVFPGFALVVLAVWRQPVGRAALVGTVAGAAFWGPHISWLTLYLGPIPWLALCTVMVAWVTLFGVAASLVTHGLERISWLNRHRALLLTAQSLAVAGLWVSKEQLQSVWPYGGFAWGRLAYPLADVPLGSLASWLGFAGLTGLVAIACTVPVALVLGRARPVVALITTGGVVLGLFGLSWVPAAALDVTGTIRIAAVQGDSQSAIFDDRENGDVLRDHLRATEDLLDRLEANHETVDVIVWPENSAEFGLNENTRASLAIAQLAHRAGAPIVTGTVLRDLQPDGTTRYTNSSLVVLPSGELMGRYDKRFPVPFAEYMPNRDFFHSLVPELVDLVQLDYSHGTLSPVIEVPLGGSGESIWAGLAICFDIIFDDQAVVMDRDQAQIIFAQTNNADFGRTDESAQQLQIAKLRAIESGRALVNISTVGTSAVVLPDGQEISSLTPFTSDAMVAEVPLVQGSTPALRYGALVTAVWMVLGGLGLAAGAAATVRRRFVARAAA